MAYREKDKVFIKVMRQERGCGGSEEVFKEFTNKQKVNEMKKLVSVVSSLKKLLMKRDQTGTAECGSQTWQ